MSYDPIAAFYAACPGVVPTRDMLAAVVAAGPLNAAQIQALVLPLMPEGNPPQYTRTAPPEPPVIMPGASPTFPPALPPQPNVPIPASRAGETVLTWAKGLPRFADNNPDPLDGWAIDNPANWGTGW